MNRDDHRIWSNADLDLEDWRDELLEEAQIGRASCRERV